MIINIRMHALDSIRDTIGQMFDDIDSDDEFGCHLDVGLMDEILSHSRPVEKRKVGAPRLIDKEPIIVKVGTFDSMIAGYTGLCRPFLLNPNVHYILW